MMGALGKLGATGALTAVAVLVSLASLALVVFDQSPGENSPEPGFARDMSVHHAQAVEMARLARTRAADPSVRRLAARIAAAQGPEILLMAAWLEEQGVEVPGRGDDPMAYDHAAHGHDGMEGMLTPDQLDELRADVNEKLRVQLMALVGVNLSAIGAVAALLR